jgi:hypothetical protein
MVRRLIIGGLMAGLAAPVFAVAPANAAILFSCSSFTGSATISPGLSHNQTAQNVSAAGSITGCTNGDSASVGVGSGAGWNAFTNFPPKPLGCPTALGGAGPDYADQTPILFGPDPSFGMTWSLGGSSTGIAKAKSNGPANPGTVRSVLVITSGKYAAPAGQKTKVKGRIDFVPTDSFTCADDSDPISSVALTNNGSVIVQQK